MNFVFWHSWVVLMMGIGEMKAHLCNLWCKVIKHLHTDVYAKVLHKPREPNNMALLYLISSLSAAQKLAQVNLKKKKSAVYLNWVFSQHISNTFYFSYMLDLSIGQWQYGNDCRVYNLFLSVSLHLSVLLSLSLRLCIAVSLSLSICLALSVSLCRTGSLFIRPLRRSFCLCPSFWPATSSSWFTPGGCTWRTSRPSGEPASALYRHVRKALARWKWCCCCCITFKVGMVDTLLNLKVVRWSVTPTC